MYKLHPTQGDFHRNFAQPCEIHKQVIPNGIQLVSFMGMGYYVIPSPAADASVNFGSFSLFDESCLDKNIITSAVGFRGLEVSMFT